jgi:hypothetical protein
MNTKKKIHVIEKFFYYYLIVIDIVIKILFWLKIKNFLFKINFLKYFWIVLM